MTGISSHQVKHFKTSGKGSDMRANGSSFCNKISSIWLGQAFTEFLSQYLNHVASKEREFCCCFCHCCCCSVAKLCLTLWPHGLKHARLPCPSLFPRICSNSCLLSQWCYLTISSLGAFFSFCLQSFPALQYFPVSRLLALGGQSVGALASATALPLNIQGWFPLGLTHLISL